MRHKKSSKSGVTCDNIIDGVKVDLGYKGERATTDGWRLVKLYNFEGGYGCRREWVWACVRKSLGKLYQDLTCLSG